MTLAADAQAPFDAVPFGDRIDAEEIAESLEFFDDWEDRYRYIIDLGRELPPMPDELKTEDRYIHGCQSQVWIDHRCAEDGRWQFVVDSDALIVRGLAGIVLAALNQRTGEEIQAFDMDAYFDRLDLLNHISPTRGNGLRSMVDKIRRLAGNAA